MEAKIKWNEGDGYITATYEGNGNGSAVISSDVNEGIDREQTICVETTDGISKVDVSVSQIGLRQMFVTSDNKVFRVASGGKFAVLKEKKQLYTELDYIESTGTQYIDTGFNIDTSTDEIELILQGITTANYKWFFGEHDNNARFGLGSGDGTNKRNVAYGTTTYKAKDINLYNSQHTYIANKDGVFLDDVKICNYSSFASTSTLYLFHLNLSNQTSYMSSVRIWGYKHKRGGLIVDLIPVLDKDGIACMYDKVGDKFYYNQGEGDFIAGYKTE